MIKKLRWKFVATTMPLFSVLFVVVLVVINLLFGQCLETIQTEYLKVLAEADLPVREQPPGRPVPEEGNHSTEWLPSMLRPIGINSLCSATIDRSGQIVSLTMGPGYDEDAIRDVVAQISALSSRDGELGSYSYSKAERPDGYHIVLADSRSTLGARNYFLKNSVWIGAAILVVVFVLTLGLSGFVTRPAQDAMDQQKRFVSNASHDLKTPLASILVNADALSDECGDSRHLRNIRQEALRMKALILGLLELEKSESIPAELPQTEFDFSHTVELAILSFEGLAYEQNVTVTEEVEKPCMLRGDEESLRKVADILLDNAFRHTPAGGEIRISLSKAGSKLKFCVYNSGSHVDPEDLPHIFERFYRADKSRASEDRYGLGLAIAKEIIEAHKGTIRCANSEEGVVFSVVI